MLAESRVVPLRSIELFETGVGYFERTGSIGGSGLTTLPVPASHLDDALKSLVILSPHGGVTITSLEFGSSLSTGMARAQAGLPLDSSTPITYRDLLVSVQGESVEITTSSGRIVGRLVEVLDAPAAAAPKTTAPSTGPTGADGAGEGVDPGLILLVVTDNGAIARIATRDVSRVRPLDPAFSGRIGASLDSLSTRSAQVRRAVKLLGVGSGDVTFGYIAETPLWRPSYRLVVDDHPTSSGARGAAQSILQGWALLHNDTEEDWHGVSVKLVNGQPDSFVFPLAAPRYFQRPLVHPEQELSTVPQLMGKTPDAIWGDHVDIAGTSVGMDSIGSSGHGYGGGGSGSGYGMGSISGVSATSASNLLDIGNLASLAPAEGVEAGALFRYAIDAKMDLGAHASALVPFLSQPIDVEVVTWFDGVNASARSAVRFVNSTSQTLPSGTIALFSTTGFVGESALPRLKPGERRFVQYGADLDLDLTTKTLSQTQATKRAVFRNGLLEEHYLSTVVSRWTLDNRSGSQRRAFMLLPLRDNATITGADALDYDPQAAEPVAIVTAKEHAKTERTITSVEGLRTTTAFDAVTPVLLERLRDSTSIASVDKTVLVDAVPRAKELAESREKLARATVELGVIDRDLGRLREDLRAVSGADKGGGGPFVARILVAEDKLLTTRKLIAATEEEIKTRRGALWTALTRLVE